MFIDKKYFTARKWSNKELKKFGHLFEGDIVNVSGWKDIDKEGGFYSDYFPNKKSYTISNYKADACGMQGVENEFFLDLEADLDKNLHGKYDVAFNHTTLEHVFEAHKAFKNICDLSNDIVILVVPFLQQMHATYGDFWRFTPLTIKKLFEKEGMSVLYSSFNEHKKSSIYLFFIASKNPEKWANKINNEFSFQAKKHFLFDSYEHYVGCRSIKNSLLHELYLRVIKALGKVKTT